MVDQFAPLRVQMSGREAAVVMAALRYYRDTYLDDPDGDFTDEDAAEAGLWRLLGERLRVRIHKQLRSRGLAVPIEGDTKRLIHVSGTDTMLCECGHAHVVSLGDDGGDGGCERLGEGCSCWEWHGPWADSAAPAETTEDPE